MHLVEPHALDVRHVLQRQRHEPRLLVLVRVAQRVGRVVVEDEVALLPHDPAHADLDVPARLLEEEPLEAVLAALVRRAAHLALVDEVAKRRRRVGERRADRLPRRRRVAGRQEGDRLELDLHLRLRKVAERRGGLGGADHVLHPKRDALRPRDRLRERLLEVPREAVEGRRGEVRRLRLAALARDAAPAGGGGVVDLGGSRPEVDREGVDLLVAQHRVRPLPLVPPRDEAQQEALDRVPLGEHRHVDEAVEEHHDEGLPPLDAVVIHEDEEEEEGDAQPEELACHQPRVEVQRAAVRDHRERRPAGDAAEVEGRRPEHGADADGGVGDEDAVDRGVALGRVAAGSEERRARHVVRDPRLHAQYVDRRHEELLADHRERVKEDDDEQEPHEDEGPVQRLEEGRQGRDGLAARRRPLRRRVKRRRWRGRRTWQPRRREGKGDRLPADVMEVVAMQIRAGVHREVHDEVVLSVRPWGPELVGVGDGYHAVDRNRGENARPNLLVERLRGRAKLGDAKLLPRAIRRVEWVGVFERAADSTRDPRRREHRRQDGECPHPHWRRSVSGCAHA